MGEDDIRKLAGVGQDGGQSSQDLLAHGKGFRCPLLVRLDATENRYTERGAKHDTGVRKTILASGK